MKAFSLFILFIYLSVANSFGQTPTCREFIKVDIPLSEHEELTYKFPCSIPDGSEVEVAVLLTIEAEKAPTHDWWLTFQLENPHVVVIDAYKVNPDKTWTISGTTTSKVDHGTVSIVFRNERSVVDAIRGKIRILKNSSLLVIKKSNSSTLKTNFESK